MSLRQSPLREEHVALGARLVEFGGWEMPLSYEKGTIFEHLACRRDAVIFDVSHLGTVRLEGSGAFGILQEAFTNDLGRIAIGAAQYTHLLDEADASVLDDCIIWWVDEQRFDVMPNASNTEGVRSVIGGEDVTATRAICALQGPHARQLLHAVAPEAAEVGHFRVAPFSFLGAPCIAAGTGYTGEDGVECALPVEVAPAFWRAALQSGFVPAGLGARDTLRLEAGLPLHSHELGPGITPLQAGLSWVVSWDKGPFRGRAPLDEERQRGPARRLRGLVGDSRRPLHAGDDCLVAGESIGYVTSGNYSPILERGIGLALLATRVKGDATVDVATRGATIQTVVTRPPFHRLSRAPEVGRDA